MTKKKLNLYEVDVWFKATASSHTEAEETVKRRLQKLGLFDEIDFFMYDGAAYEVDEISD